MHAARSDNGEMPAAIDRTAMQSFLHHLACLESTGQISRDQGAQACQDTGRALSRIRALGQTAPV